MHTRLPLTPCCAVAALLIAAASASPSLNAQPGIQKIALPPSSKIELVATPMLTVTAPILASPVYAGVRTAVTLKIENAKNGTVVSVRPISQPSVPCGFLAAEPAAATTATVNGTTNVVINGMFPHTLGAQPSRCAFKAEVTATRLDGTTSTSVVSSSSVTLAPSAVYVVTNTSDWLSKFAFSNTAASGDCTGASNGPSGIFRVGLVTSESGQANVDLTFKIRSGPTGTRCTWVSQPMLLPEGVKLTLIEVGGESSEKCSSTSPNAQYAGFASAANPVVSAGSVVGANPLGSGYQVQGIAPITIQLVCGNTMFNDRFTTFIIKSLTFIGPPQLTGFP
jgi:hypothetical protein